MNLIDARVTKVLGVRKMKSPYNGEVDWWLTKVEYIDDGGKNEEELLRLSEEEANEIKEGYIYQH